MKGTINRFELERNIIALGMTITEMCKKSGIDKSNYYKQAKKGSLTIDMIAKINEGTGIDPVAYVYEAQEERGIHDTDKH